MSSSISSAGSSQAALQTNPFRQRANDMQALGKALESGDLDAAKEAFASLQANAPKGPPPGGGSGDGKIKADFETLAKALADGDTDAAKTAFETLQKDMKAARAAHGHRHKPSGDQADATAALSLFSGTSSTSATASTGISITA
jgi:hypothetical protein